MYFLDLDVKEAILLAKRLRPIIDPIGQLPEFLRRLRAALQAIDFHYDPKSSPLIEL